MNDRGVVERLRDRQDKYERLIEEGEWNRVMSLPVATGELGALLAVVEAAKGVADFEQTYATHDDDSSDDGPPTCTVCGEWGDRVYALDDALAALDSQARPQPSVPKDGSSSSPETVVEGQAPSED